MLYFYSGSDREKARGAMRLAAEKAAGKKGEVVRVTDAHSVADLEAALRAGGMFFLAGQAAKRVVVLDGILANDEMRDLFFSQLPVLVKGGEDIFLFEEKPDAATRKTIEKHAEKTEKFDAPKVAKGGNEIFALASALRRGDKKALWVGYQRALARDEAPEAIHGILFWGAKQAFLSSKADSPERRRGIELV